MSPSAALCALAFASLSLLACAKTPDAPPPATPAPADTSTVPPSTTPTPSPAAAPTPPAPSGDSLATQVMAKSHAPFDACVSDAHHKRTTSIDVTFTMADDGVHPMTVELAYKNKMDDGAKECLRRAALALTFPAGTTGKQTGTLTLAPSK